MSVMGSMNPLLSARASDSAATLAPLTVDQSAALQKAMSSRVTKAKAPVLLRQVFHDSGTFDIADGSGGPNASLQFELERPENRGLKRAWTTVQDVRAHDCHNIGMYLACCTDGRTSTVPR